MSSSVSKRRYVVLNDGRRKLLHFYDGEPGVIEYFHQSCTGCFEFGDYGGNAHHYPYSDNHGCYVGAGCDECGYHGVRKMDCFIPLKHCLDNWRGFVERAAPDGPVAQ